jgi:hypothetical protein
VPHESTLLYKDHVWYNNFTGMIFVSYLTDFSYFSLERNCRKSLNNVRTGQKWTIWKGCRSFQLFFIDFQLFYFLTRNFHGFIAAKEVYDYSVNFTHYCTKFSHGFPHSEDSVENSKVVSGNYPPLFECMHYLHNLNRFDHFFGEITIKTSDRIHQI